MEEERFEAFTNFINGLYWDIQKLKAKWTEPLGMKAVHIFWVYLLRKHPEGLSPSELSRHTQSNRSLVSREIRELIQLGYVAYQQERDIRRHGQRLILTPEGIQVSDTIRKAALDIQNTVNSGISEEDLQVFYKTLARLQQNFDLLAQQ